MTIGEAVGKVLQHYIDNTDMPLSERRRVIEAIHPVCKLVTNTHLPPLNTIYAVLDKKMMEDLDG